MERNWDGTGSEKIKNDVVIHRECDEAMAKSKGIIGKRETNMEKCRENCGKCIACIETDIEGNREHVNVRRNANERL